MFSRAQGGVEIPAGGDGDDPEAREHVKVKGREAARACMAVVATEAMLEIA